MIHRPFIAFRNKNLSFTFAALSESVMAARLCTSSLYALYERQVPLAFPQFQVMMKPAFPEQRQYTDSPP